MTTIKHYYKFLFTFSLICFSTFSFGQSQEKTLNTQAQQSNKELLAKASGVTPLSYQAPSQKWHFDNKKEQLVKSNFIGLSLVNTEVYDADLLGEVTLEEKDFAISKNFFFLPYALNWRTDMNAIATYFMRERTLTTIKTPFNSSKTRYFTRIDCGYKQLNVLARYSVPVNNSVYLFRQVDYMYSNILFNGVVNVSPSMGLNYVLPRKNNLSLEYSLYILNPSDVKSVTYDGDGSSIRNNNARGSSLKLRYFMK